MYKQYRQAVKLIRQQWCGATSRYSNISPVPSLPKRGIGPVKEIPPLKKENQGGFFTRLVYPEANYCLTRTQQIGYL